MTTPSSVFICYRRDDGGEYAQAILERLAGRLGHHEVFLDMKIRPGQNFVTAIERGLTSCAVMIVVIGRDWLTVTDADGKRRIDDPEDLVRQEITRGLRGDLLVLPVLVRGARMPSASELPAPLVELTQRNALEIQHRTRDFDYDVLVATLREEFGLPPHDEPPVARPPDEPPVVPPPDKPPVVPPPDEAPVVSPRDEPVLERLTSDSAGDSTGTSKASSQREFKVPRWASLGALLALVAIVVTVLIGSAGSAPRPAPIRIGALYSLTGGSGDAGHQALAGVRFALHYINHGGYPDLGLALKPGKGLPGLNGARLKLAYQDTRGDRCRAHAAFGALVKHGAVGVIGTYESSVTLQAIVAANARRVLLVNDSSTATSLTDADGHGGSERTTCHMDEPDPTPSAWFFRIGPTDADFSELFAQFLLAEQHRGVQIKRVAILHESNNIFGNHGASDIADVADRLDIKADLYPYDARLVSNSNPTAGCPRKALVHKLRTQIEAIEATQPDAIFALSYLTDAVVTVQTMARLRYKPHALLAFGAGYNDPAFLDQVQKPSRACGLPAGDPTGIITRAAGGSQVGLPAAEQAGKLFKAHYHRDMDDTVARAFTATMTLAQAISNAGSTNPDKIRIALRELQVPREQTILPGDGIRFDPSGQNLSAGTVLLQVVSGAYVSVYPAKYRTVKPSWPMSRGTH